MSCWGKHRSARATYQANVDVATNAHAVAERARDAADHLQQQRFLHVLEPPDLGCQRASETAVRVGLGRKLRDFVFQLGRQHIRAVDE